MTDRWWDEVDCHGYDVGEDESCEIFENANSISCLVICL